MLNKTPNMGKSCIRFKSITEATLRLLSDLSLKMSVEEFIELYELQRRHELWPKQLESEASSFI